MKDRITLLDSLRGFSLAVIAIAHFMEQFLGNMAPAAHQAYTRHSPMDGALDLMLWALIRGKGFALFAFLFGLGFALQMQRAARRNPLQDFRPRFVWRLMVLLCIGYAHCLLYRGDILVLYALLGLVLVLFYRVPDRWLWIVALPLLLGVPRMALQVADATHEPARQEARDAWLESQATRHWDALKQGDFPKIVALNATEGIETQAVVQFGPFSRGYQTFAYFLIGLWAGRRRLFEEAEANLGLFRNVFRWSAWFTFGLPLLAGLLLLLARWTGIWSGSVRTDLLSLADLYTWQAVAGLGFYDALSFVMTLFYVTGFVLLFQRPAWQGYLLRLAPLGKMALTSYILQSFVGVAIFVYFSCLGEVGNTVTLPLALLVIAGQVVLCRFWLDRFSYGPAEWLWRSLTWMRIQPFRKRLLSKSTVLSAADPSRKAEEEPMQ